MNFQNISPVLPITMAIFFLGLWLVLRRGHIRVTRDGLIANPSSQPPEPVMPEKYAREVLMLVERAGDHRDRLRDLQSITTEEQMRLYEETEMAAIAIFKRGFNDLLEGLATEMARREQRAFIHMVRAVLHDVKDLVRKWVRSNHYYALSTPEWEAYIQMKRQTLSHLISDAFDVEWISEAIPREKLYQIGDNYSEEFTQVVSSFFARARQVSIQHYTEGQEEKARYAAEIMRITGHDPYKAC